MPSLGVHALTQVLTEISPDTVRTLASPRPTTMAAWAVCVTAGLQFAAEGAT